MCRIQSHSQSKCCTEIGSRTLSSRTKTVPITILLLVRLGRDISEASGGERVSDIHRYSTIVGKLEFFNDVQLRESGIGSQVADFEISRLFSGRSHSSDSLST